MDVPQARLEDALEIARRLNVLDKVRLLEQVVADLEESLNSIEQRALARRENPPE